MSDSVRPQRRQPTRLPHPWDSPGKNTGVGCHFLLQCMKVKSEKWKWSRTVVSDSSQPHGLQPTRLLHPWDFPGKSTGVGCHCLLHHLILLADKSIPQYTRVKIWSRAQITDYVHEYRPRCSSYQLPQEFANTWGLSLTSTKAIRLC